MKALLVALLLLVLGGCATCQQHPVYCGIGTAIVMGSVAATVQANVHHGHAPAMANTQPVNCTQAGSCN